ncbi:DUF3389 family protein [Shewanella marina]|uniref:DUF3389 family protein n=1 Tax=Shewanella marina TaxID=487319 RepID=UPI000564044D|nr:DUF3389 family protein [Shewanella marina]
MKLEFSQGKIFITPFEVQIVMNQSGLRLFAMIDDLKLHAEQWLIVADAGAVRWQVKLDNLEQFELLSTEIGIN